MSQFIKELRGMLIPPTNEGAILPWLELAEELSQNSKWHSGFTEELNAILLALKYVRHNFSEEVLQKSLRLYIVNDEIINGALYLNAGYGVEEVQELADAGILSEGYIPTSENEVGTLTLIELDERETPLLLVRSKVKDLTREISMLSGFAEYQGLPLSLVLIEQGISELEIDKIEDKKLKTAYLQAFKTTTAVGTFLKCSLAKHEITQLRCPLLQSGEQSEKTGFRAEEKMEKESEEASAEMRLD